MRSTSRKFEALLWGGILLLLLPLSGISFQQEALAQAGSWATKASLLSARTAHQAEAVGGSVYVIGGAPGGCPALTLPSEAYNPLTDSWSPRAAMPGMSGTHARSQFASAVLDGKIYAFGGGDCLTFSDEVLVYDPATDSWTSKNPMPTGRSNSPSAAAVNGKIYLIGGSTDPSNAGVNAPMLEYDPSTDTWQPKTQMPTVRIGARAGVINGKIYVVGGVTPAGAALATLEAYDPLTDTWTTLAPMSTGRISPAVGVVDGLLYVFGGVDFSTGILDSGEVYDPSLNTWSSAPTLPVATVNAGAAVLAGVLYVTGGHAGPSGTITGNTFAFTPPAPVEVPVTIDIKPGSFPNSINPKNKGVIPVAILTTATFDATTVDPTTVRFGPTATEAAPVHSALEDVDLDGDIDMILHFNTQDTGIVCGDTSASLRGETFGGQAIVGSDSIKTVGCK